MHRNQALWLLAAAVAVYYGAVYCGELLTALHPALHAWFGGNPLPALAEYALGASGFVARLGPWIAVALVVFAAASWFWNRQSGATGDKGPAVLNAVGYYAARGVLILLVALALLQAHGMLIIFLNIDRQVRQELGKPVAEIKLHGEGRALRNTPAPESCPPQP